MLVRKQCISLLEMCMTPNKFENLDFARLVEKFKWNGSTQRKC